MLDETIAYEPPIPQKLIDEDVLAALETIPTQYREVQAQSGSTVAEIDAGRFRCEVRRGKKEGSA
ncbi:MAG TPA: hypothetical protein VFV34_14745 [Blastocatellia bacterium]|nr:hypothetical protein [Blastocatellia bacterium]